MYNCLVSTDIIKKSLLDVMSADSGATRMFLKLAHAKYLHNLEKLMYEP